MNTKRSLIFVLSIALLLGSGAASAEASKKPSVLAGIAQAMTQAEQLIEASSLYADDPVRKAEAIDYLLKTLSFHLDRDFLAGDPAHPRLIYNPGFGAPNVDTLYLYTPLDPAGSYRVYGEMGSVNQTIFGLYSDRALDGEEGAGARIKGDAIKLKRDGTFELFLSAEEQGENWLPLHDDVSSFTIYQIFGDWEHERKGKLYIERLDTLNTPSSLPSEQQFQQQLNAFHAGLIKNVTVWLKVFEQIFNAPANVFMKPRTIQVASLGSFFSHAHWHIETDQALIIEFDEPADASYWSFSCYTAWTDTLDPGNRHSSLNFTQTVPDQDGKYRIVMAASDPGVANWLDIEGHPEGVINWRVTTETRPAAPKVTVVPLADIRKQLPGAATVTAEQRDSTLTARKRHMQHRMSF